ncbi:N-acetyltransferase family protein [Ensifer sp. 4252]|uniref:GNAT family N-acetyltransferase n=1 Tax=Ensifer sp. 4252 TaxID=3373915 RepID=UPI003D1D8653
MKIRSATIADCDSLVALDTVAAGDPERRDHIRSWIEAGCCYVAETNKSVGAYGVLAYHFFGNGFVEMVMVGEHFRRQGLGMALVEHFKAICVTPKLFASTNLSNQKMQQLLSAAGFHTSGYIDNLDENDPEIVFFVRATP